LDDHSPTTQNTVAHNDDALDQLLAEAQKCFGATEIASEERVFED